MQAVYRPAFSLLSIAVLASLGSGCGSGERPSAPAPPVVRPGAFPLATLLDSRSARLIDVDASTGAALYSTLDGRGRRRHFLRAAGSAGTRELSLGDAEAVARIGTDRLLIRTLSGVAAEPFRVVRIDGAAPPVTLPLALTGPRRLGGASDAAVVVAGRTASGSEALFAISTSTLVVERLGEFPAGFEVEAVSLDANWIALRRSLHPEADELYLHRRNTGETRLLLPDGADARFVPVAFAPDGSALLMLTDEGEDLTRLEWLDLSSGARSALPPPIARRGAEVESCDVVSATLSADAERIAEVAVCSGVRSARWLDAASGAPSPLPPLPGNTWGAELLLRPDGEAIAIDLASARLPRDLLLFPNGQPEPTPLTWGLAPGIDPRYLFDPETEWTASSAGAQVPIELWLPRRPSGGREGIASPPAGSAALIWLEDDVNPPAWGEFDPLFQFLAGEGVAVARLRLRGSDGFGRRFRHAADGRPVAAAIEDLDLARATLERRVGAIDRWALVGAGGWPAAIASALAGSRIPSETPFAAIVAAAADPDPLAEFDGLQGVPNASVSGADRSASASGASATLPEPAFTYWLDRLGAPDLPSSLAARAALRRPADEAVSQAPIEHLLTTADPIRPAELWQFLRPRLRER